MPKKRPPLHGYNHNLQYAGRVFHVQTEDYGADRGLVVTLVFLGGNILAALRVPYDGELEEEVVRQLMQNQHKAAMKRVVNGTLDERLPRRSSPPRPARRPSGAPRAPFPHLASLPEVAAQPGVSSGVVEAPAAFTHSPSVPVASEPGVFSGDSFGEEGRVVALVAEPPDEEELLLLRLQLAPEPGVTPAPPAAAPGEAQRRQEVRVGPGGVVIVRPVAPPPSARGAGSAKAPASPLRPEKTQVRLPAQAANNPPVRPWPAARPSGVVARSTAEGVVVRQKGSGRAGLVQTVTNIRMPPARTGSPAPPPGPAEPADSSQSLDPSLLDYLADGNRGE